MGVKGVGRGKSVSECGRSRESVSECESSLRKSVTKSVRKSVRKSVIN